MDINNILRKMQILVVLGGLFLVVYAQEKCRREPNEIKYYIYNTNVWINTFAYPDRNYNCEQHPHWKTKIMYFSEFLKTYGNIFTRLQCEYTLQQCKFCIHSLYAKLLENTVIDEFHQNFLYEAGTATLANYLPSVYWNSNLCWHIELVYEGTFNIWTDSQSQYKYYIQNQLHTLDLVNGDTLCGVSVWRTSYSGIIVSTNHITTAKNTSLTYLFNNTLLYDNCTNTKNQPTHLVPTKRPTYPTTTHKEDIPPKKWFIYKYPEKVTVHFCVQSGNQSNVDSSLLKQCMDKFPKLSKASSIGIETKTLLVYLRTDTISTLPRECKYSEGICQASQAFWSYTSKCGNVVKIFEGHENKCNNSKCVVNNSINLTLQAPGQLCGVNVTYTNLIGIVASEVEIDFSPPLSDDDVDKILMRYDDKINYLEHWLLLFVILCVLCYFFNVIVNFISLKKLNKRKGIRNKTTLLNCVSQGLTTRYILRKSEPASSQFEIVENDIYNKPKYTRNH